MCFKDTKNKVTWLCLIAPTIPMIATRRRKTPHATTPPRIGRLVIRAVALAYTVTPIRISAINCGRKETEIR